MSTSDLSVLEKIVAGSPPLVLVLIVVSVVLWRKLGERDAVAAADRREFMEAISEFRETIAAHTAAMTRLTDAYERGERRSPIRAGGD